jgi:hypothetical protein
MQSVVVFAIEDSQEYQTGRTDYGSNGRAYRIKLLPDRCVWRKLARVSQPAFENEGAIEGNDGDGGHGDEHGFEVVGTNI